MIFALLKASITSCENLVLSDIVIPRLGALQGSLGRILHPSPAAEALGSNFKD
jgi:hypothetical protein